MAKGLRHCGAAIGRDQFRRRNNNCGAEIREGVRREVASSTRERTKRRILFPLALRAAMWPPSSATPFTPHCQHWSLSHGFIPPIDWLEYNSEDSTSSRFFERGNVPRPRIQQRKVSFLIFYWWSCNYSYKTFSNWKINFLDLFTLFTICLKNCLWPWSRWSRGRTIALQKWKHRSLIMLRRR